MTLRGFDITNCQVGWRSYCCFMVETANQYTAEEHLACEGSRWMIVAVLKSYLTARRIARELAAKPGERKAKGWV